MWCGVVWCVVVRCVVVCLTVLLSVGVVRCDGERRLLSDAHLSESLVPPSDDLPPPNDELERAVPLLRRIELRPTALQSTRVMRNHSLTALGKRLTITWTSRHDVHTHGRRSTEGRGINRGGEGRARWSR